MEMEMEVDLAPDAVADVCPAQMEIVGESQGEVEPGSSPPVDKELLNKVFGNHLIASEMSVHLSITDLKNCRHVSKAWNVNLMEGFKKRSLVIVNSSGRYTDFKAMVESRAKKKKLPFPFRDLELRLDDCFSAPDILELTDFLFVRNVKVFSLLRLSLRLSSSPAVVILRTQCGTITSLNVYDWDVSAISAADSDWASIRQCLTDLKVPRLETLYLSLTHSNNPTSSVPGTTIPDPFGLLVDFINQLLVSAPLLKTFDVQGSVQNEWQDDVLLRVFSPGNTRSIQKLNICARLPKDKLRDVLKSVNNTQLKSLTLNLEPCCQSIYKFLSYSAITLRRLDLFSTKLKPEDYDIWFPHCPLVTDLILPKLAVGGDLKFLAKLPALKTLTVKRLVASLSVIDDDIANAVPCPKVESLYIHKMEPTFEFSTELLEWLHAKFPKIVKWGFSNTVLRGFVAAINQNRPTGIPFVTHIQVGCVSRYVNFEEDLQRARRAQNMNLDLSLLIGLYDLTHIQIDTYRYKGILTIPFKYMVKTLRSIQIYWCPQLNQFFRQQKAYLKRLARVYIMNCCAFRRSRDPDSWREIREFFQENPNAVCSCKRDPEDFPPPPLPPKPDFDPNYWDVPALEDDEEELPDIGD